MTAPALPAPRVTLEDPAAPHQIIIGFIPDPRAYHHAMVPAMTCTCRPLVPRGWHGGRRRHEPVSIRYSGAFPAAEAIAAWRAWHQQRGVELP